MAKKTLDVLGFEGSLWYQGGLPNQRAFKRDSALYHETSGRPGTLNFSINLFGPVIMSTQFETQNFVAELGKQPSRTADVIGCSVAMLALETASPTRLSHYVRSKKVGIPGDQELSTSRKIEIYTEASSLNLSRHGVYLTVSRADDQPERYFPKRYFWLGK